MTDTTAPTSSASVPLRVWPAVLIVALVWAAILLPGKLMPDSVMIPFLGMMYGTMGGVLLFLIWWLFFSRAGWPEKLLALVTTGVGIGGVVAFGHLSMNFFTLFFYLTPILLTAFAGWLLIAGSLDGAVRRAGSVVVILAACAAFLAVRLEGTDGSFKASWKPRWQKTEEDVFLAERAPKTDKQNVLNKNEPPLVLTAGDWPEFRGSPERQSILKGVAINTDWEKNPPKLLWKHRVGPGWSSFAVIGDRAFTQEQRGPDEVVVCYDTKTGNEIWVHADKARFTEVIAGPGPRATPTFHDGKIYAQGAAGKLNCLDARTGDVIWSRDIVADSGSTVPTWGFSASPLIVNGIVTVYGGAKDKAILAYKADNGEPAWSTGNGEISYCSTQRSVIDGVEQLLISTNEGVLSVDPTTGKQLWRYDWPLAGMARVVQPYVIGSDVLLGTSFDMGTRRFTVSQQNGSWDTKDVWTSRAIKPYYNDFVIFNDHLYGFDGPFFNCIDLKDGKRKWRERGYGNGQVLLLADQGLLLILAETGEVAVVAADPASHREIARMDALEGKTWNHPVIAHGKLLVRNGQEAACYELAPASVGSGK